MSVDKKDGKSIIIAVISIVISIINLFIFHFYHNIELTITIIGDIISLIMPIIILIKIPIFKILIRHKIITVIIILITSVLPIILQFVWGHFYRIHHLINNIIVVPILIYFALDYIYKSDKKYNFIEICENSKLSIIYEIYPLLLQLSYSCTVFFIYSYEHKPAKIYFNETIFISVDSLNSIFLLTCTYVIISFGLFIFTFLTFYKNENIHFKDIFPHKVFIGILAFLLVWSLMTYYETENIIEDTFYISTYLYAIVLSVLICFYTKNFNISKSRAYLIFYFILIVFNLVYSFIVKRLNDIEFSNILIKDNPPDTIGSISVIILIVFFITFAGLYPKIKNKYDNDKQNTDSQD